MFRFCSGRAFRTVPLSSIGRKPRVKSLRFGAFHEPIESLAGENQSAAHSFSKLPRPLMQETFLHAEVLRRPGDVQPFIVARFDHRRHQPREGDGVDCGEFAHECGQGIAL